MKVFGTFKSYPPKQLLFQFALQGCGYTYNGANALTQDNVKTSMVWDATARGVQESQKSYATSKYFQWLNI